MKKFNTAKYDGSKYDYHGNVYEFGGLETIDIYDGPSVMCYNVNDDTFLMIPPAKFEDFHNKYVIK